jgi:hypothetical protein
VAAVPDLGFEPEPSRVGVWYTVAASTPTPLLAFALSRVGFLLMGRCMGQYDKPHLTYDADNCPVTFEATQGPEVKFGATTDRRFPHLDSPSEVGGHVREAGVVPLERHRDGVGGPVAVLGDDEVGLALAR